MEVALARIDAVKRVVDAVRTSPIFPVHAQNQAASLKHFFSSQTLSSGEVSQLVVAVTNIGLPEDTTTDLIGELGKHLAPLEKNANGKLQDYRNFPFYFPTAMWKDILSDEVNAMQILNKINVFVIEKLALRSPSCPTFGAIATTYNWLHRGEDGVLAMTPEDKYKEVQFVKKVFRQRVKVAPELIGTVKVLPPSPTTLYQMHPSLRPDLESTPAVPPIDVDMVLAVAATFPLRKEKCSTMMAPQSTFKSKGFQEPQGQQMAQFMETLINNQMRMMSSMFRPSEDPCPITVYGGRHAAAKRALADAAAEGGTKMVTPLPLEAGPPTKAGKLLRPSVSVLPPAVVPALKDDEAEEEDGEESEEEPAAPKRETASAAKGSLLGSLLARESAKASKARARKPSMKPMKAMKAFMLTTGRPQQGIAQRLRHPPPPQASLTSVA